jgi:NAD(P)-dependent dehydrogenase (short-subunit alcohol dehydrogenase family)
VGDFEGQVIVVTAGTGIIGRAAAAAFADAGARVVIVDGDATEGASALESLGTHGDVRFTVANVADPTDAARLVAEVGAEFGRIDVLVHQGITRFRSSVLTISDDDWRTDMETGLSSAIYVGRAVASAMAGHGGGTIVQVTAVDVDQATSGRATASVASNAVVGLTRALAVEWAGIGVRVNAVVPGPVLDLDDDRLLDDEDRSIGRVRLRAPAHRFTSPDEVARAILFLSGNRSAFVTGQVLFADGGWNAWTQHPDGMRFP